MLRIQNYLNRFHEIIDQDDPARKEHALDLIKGRFHQKYIIKPNEIPKSYWENQRRIIRERGQGGDLEHVNWEELKRQNTEAIIADQQSSLDKWVNYLSSPDAPYSDALKYFTLRSITNMGEYDKEKKIYPQRSIGTTKPFPDLNREALAYVLDVVDRKYKGQDTQGSPEFEKLLQGENFAKLYAWAIEKVTPASEEELLATKGEWVKYGQGSDHMPLVQSLQGHGTGWCTAGESTAQTQLKGGDFYVYYSLDKDGNPTVPRAAIRMEESRIVEIRGVAKEQNLDSGAESIVEEKLREFPDGERYKKKVSDMKLLTAIDNKTKQGEVLSKEELTFLYELDSSIEGFGYQKDPRIKELQAQRNSQEDMPVVFGCDKSQIARKASEIRPDTKAYVGKLEKGIFDRLQGIEHVYTSFPEGKILIDELTIGGKSKDSLRKTLKQANIQVSSYTEDMIKNPDFTTLPNPKVIKTARLKVQDLDLKEGATTSQVYARADELGLDPCLPETGVYQRLKDANQPLGEWYWIAMKQIADRDGRPYVFRLYRRDVGLWLSSGWALPDYGWDPGHEFMFTLRKSEPQKPGLLDRFLKH